MAHAEIVQEAPTVSTDTPAQPDPYLKKMLDHITEDLQRPPEPAEVEPPLEQRQKDAPRQDTPPAPAPRPRRADFGRD